MTKMLLFFMTIIKFVLVTSTFTDCIYRSITPNLLSVFCNQLNPNPTAINLENDFCINKTNLSIEIVNKNIPKIFKNSFESNNCQLQTLHLSSNQIIEIESGAFNQLSNLRELHLDDNKIEYILVDTFGNGNLTSLEDLWLQLNSISHIEVGSFSGMKNLKKLILHINSIRIIQNGTFSDLSLLYILSLRNNMIEVIETGSFDSMEKLIYLYLYGNRLKSIEPNIFNDLINLQYLYLHENEISRVDEVSFNHLTSLKILSLNYNNLEYFNLSLVSACQNLEILHLYSNQLKEVYSSHEITTSLTKLNSLHIRINKIDKWNQNYIFSSMASFSVASNLLEVIPSYAFANPNRLVTIEFESNQINSIKANAFWNLNAAEKLDLSSNSLKVLESHYFKWLVSLKTLDLGSNEIASIEADTFRSLPLLNRLDLTDNNFFYLESFYLQGLSNLNYLYLSQNQLKSINRGDFSDLTNLIELDLSSNRIESIENGAFESLNTVVTIYLYSNRLKSLNGNLHFLSSLTKIDLSQNCLESIDNETFRYNSNLNSLNLNSNCLISIDPEICSSLFNLRELGLSSTQSNNLTISFRINQMTNLTSIDLSNNFNLTLVYNASSFKPPKLKQVKFRNTSLESIRFIRTWLDPNQIESLDLSDNNLGLNVSTALIFGTLTNLKEFFLSNVGLNSIDLIRLEKLKQLVRLDLSSNSFVQASLKCSTISQLVNLDYLDLSNNAIETIDGCLLNKKNLSYLYLSNNRIKSIGSNYFEKLTKIDLSRNLLESFPIFSFNLIDNSHLKNLFWIDLSSNSIRDLIMPELFKIKEVTYFDLSRNMLERINQPGLFQQLIKLEYFSLAYNYITSIDQRTFSNLISLQYLNLSSNPISQIAARSFNDLEKLVLLNLSNTSLSSLNINVFEGLSYLKDFYFEISNVTVESIFLSTNSPNGATSLKNVYVSKEALKFSHRVRCQLKRDFKPRINRDLGFVRFYESINVLTRAKDDDADDVDCQLVFMFLQLNLHLNLKTDADFAKFFDSCNQILSQDEYSIQSMFEGCL